MSIFPWKSRFILWPRTLLCRTLCDSNKEPFSGDYSHLSFLSCGLVLNPCPSAPFLSARSSKLSVLLFITLYLHHCGSLAFFWLSLYIEDTFSFFFFHIFFSIDHSNIIFSPSLSFSRSLLNRTSFALLLSTFLLSWRVTIFLIEGLFIIWSSSDNW